jgi:hypothetical protein
MDFIAHARTDLPLALEMIDLLRNRLCAVQLVINDSLLTGDIHETLTQVNRLAAGKGQK